MSSRYVFFWKQSKSDGPIINVLVVQGLQSAFRFSDTSSSVPGHCRLSPVRKELTSRKRQKKRLYDIRHALVRSIQGRKYNSRKLTISAHLKANVGFLRKVISSLICGGYFDKGRFIL